jgi:hypothetical protein
MSDILPYELWEKIFLNLQEVSDLKSVSETCSFFNDIIGKSAEMMDQFCLRIDGNSFDLDCLKIMQRSRRQYKHLVLVGEKPSVEISGIFECMKLSGSYQEILKSVVCEKLDDSLYVFGVFYDIRISIVPITADFALGLLSKLEIDRMRSAYIKDFIELLKREKNLKELSLNYMEEDEAKLLFHTKDFEDFKFQLERFSCTCDMVSTRVSIGILKFTYFQHQHLKQLELGNVWISKKIANPGMLKLTEFSYSFDKRYSHVSSLKTFLANCLELTSLQLSKLCFNLFIKNAVNKLEKLEKLALYNCDFDVAGRLTSDVTCKVSQLSIFINHRVHEFPYLSFPNLKEVSVDGHHFIELLICVKKLLKIHDLDKLVIGLSMKLLDQELKRILKNTGKLKHLDIQNGSKLSGSFLNLDAFLSEHLERVRIFDCTLNVANIPDDTSEFRPSFELLVSAEKFS